MINVLKVILGLSFLIFFHELGHYLLAKFNGVGVKEFAIGFGPKLLQKKSKSGTYFTLRAIPLGGYVSMLGEGDEFGIEDDEEAKQLEGKRFSELGFWRKFSILVSGVAFNFILAFILIIIAISTTSVTVYEGTILESTSTSGVIQENDILKSIEDVPLVETAYFNLGKKLDGNNIEVDPSEFKKLDKLIEIERNGEILSYTVGEYFGSDGLILLNYSNATPSKITGRNTLAFSGYTFVALNKMMFEGFEMLFTQEASMDDVSGPVGIVQLGAERASNTSDLMYLLAIISINLAILNILPLPVLDGGHILFLILGLFISDKFIIPIKKYSSIAFASILILFSIFITYKDLLSLL